ENAMAEAAAASTAAPAVIGGWTKHVPCRYFMHGLCKEGDNCRYLHDLSSCKPTMICKFFQKGCCAFGDRCRYEHTKPAKQDEVPSSKPPVPLTAAPLAGTPEPVSDGPGGTTDAQEKPQGLGAVDWVNAAEFVPGQPYCGRGECSRERCSVVIAKTICENTVPADKPSIRCTI
uniref:RING-type E3 ubiquitin transferase n=2 Tax=Sinocyclocheilus rhinocerous TaxID=307959 RepID=A0A673J8R9_9TELE